MASEPKNQDVIDVPTSWWGFLTLLEVVKGYFLHQGQNSVIIHFSYLPWSFRPFGLAELTSAFLLYHIFDLASPKVSASGLMG